MNRREVIKYGLSATISIPFFNTQANANSVGFQYLTSDVRTLLPNCCDQAKYNQKAMKQVADLLFPIIKNEINDQTKLKPSQTEYMSFSCQDCGVSIDWGHDVVRQKQWGLLDNELQKMVDGFIHKIKCTATTHSFLANLGFFDDVFVWKRRRVGFYLQGELNYPHSANQVIINTNRIKCKKN